MRGEPCASHTISPSPIWKTISFSLWAKRTSLDIHVAKLLLHWTFFSCRCFSLHWNGPFAWLLPWFSWFRSETAFLSLESSPKQTQMTWYQSTVSFEVQDKYQSTRNVCSALNLNLQVLSSHDSFSFIRKRTFSACSRNRNFSKLYSFQKTALDIGWSFLLQLASGMELFMASWLRQRWKRDNQWERCGSNKSNLWVEFWGRQTGMK